MEQYRGAFKVNLENMLRSRRIFTRSPISRQDCGRRAWSSSAGKL